MNAFEKHDLATARVEQGKSIDLIKTLGSFGFLAASKSVMAMLGVDCGPVRAPVRNLTSEQRLAALGQAARAWMSSRGPWNGRHDAVPFLNLRHRNNLNLPSSRALVRLTPPAA